MAEWFPLPGEFQSPYSGHGKHLCVAQAVKYLETNLEDYKNMVRDGKFVCKNCGRVANKAEYLCNPDAL